MVYNPRCIVPGCTASIEDANFRRQMNKDGHAWCPIHQRDNSACGCTKDSQLTLFHKFPKSPGLRCVWLSLIGVRQDYLPSVSETVCSRHFDMGGKRKVPTLLIGRPEVEIKQILEENVKRMILRQAEPRYRTQRDVSASTSKLADAFVSIADAVEGESAIAPDLEEFNFGHIYGEPATEARETAAAASTGSDGFSEVDQLSQEIQNISIDDDDSRISVKRKPRSPQTPESASKRLRGYSTPDYRRGGTSVRVECARVDCHLKTTEIESFKTETARLSRELFTCRMKLHLAEKKLDEPCSNCPQEKATVASLKEELEALRDAMDLLPEGIDLSTQRPVVDTETISANRFFALTGMALTNFRCIFNVLEPRARRASYWQGPAKTAPRMAPVSEESKPTNAYEQEFILFLMRLRLNLNVELLAQIFKCSVGTVSMIFHTWLDLFSRQLSWMIYFPDQWTAWSHLPEHVAQKFPRLRCTVDCTEVEMQRPQLPYLQCITFSNYKKRNTVKFLVAILGNGAIGFVSKAFTGRTSDKFIMNHCGLMDLLTAGDQVLADRGFGITDEMLLKQVDLNVPPAGTGVVQFTSEQVYQTKKIAHVRIHVERGIRRMKCYSILTGVIPINVLPSIDKIITSAAILCNLQDPLVK